MAVVYILYSEKRDKYYIGSCVDLKTRLSQHWDKTFPNSYTALSEDWSLFFKIEDLNYEVARKIETHIKNMKSRVFILNLTKYPEITQKLILKYT